MAGAPVTVTSSFKKGCLSTWMHPKDNEGGEGIGRQRARKNQGMSSALEVQRSRQEQSHRDPEEPWQGLCSVSLRTRSNPWELPLGPPWKSIKLPPTRWGAQEKQASGQIRPKEAKGCAECCRGGQKVLQGTRDFLSSWGMSSRQQPGQECPEIFFHHMLDAAEEGKNLPRTSAGLPQRKIPSWLKGVNQLFPE